MLHSRLSSLFLTVRASKVGCRLESLGFILDLYHLFSVAPHCQCCGHDKCPFIGERNALLFFADAFFSWSTGPCPAICHAGHQGWFALRGNSPCSKFYRG